MHKVLIKLANYLNTSIDYLLDLTDDPIRHKKNNNDVDELILYFNRLDKNGKKDVITYTKIREKMY